jgi:hypothetical protein
MIVAIIVDVTSGRRLVAAAVFVFASLVVSKRSAGAANEQHQRQGQSEDE